VNKVAAVLVPVMVMLFGLPMAIALLVMTVTAPAAAEQLRTIVCGGATPVTGSWRPPFAQAYVVGRRGFGEEYHPIYHEWRMHTGQDLVSQPGPAPVVAIGAGRVVFAAARGGYGNVVDVEHIDDTTQQAVVSRYAHLASMDVSVGAQVAAGQQLGVEGSTGTSTGNHLHFEIRIGDTPVDPVPWMLTHGAPLNGHATTDWTAPPRQPVAEGGVGFPLPPPGTPRQASLRTPAAPIPPDIRRLYVAAADRYMIPWTLLAGIGMEETAHGRLAATSSAGARGLMQFMPDTWAAMGVDGDGDGRADITNDADSIMSAANYVTRSGVDKGPSGVRSALFAYNHADWYVNDVLFYAAAYGGGTVLGSATECVAGEGNVDLPPLTSDRLRVLLGWASSQVGYRYVMGATGPDAWDCSSFTQTAFAQIGVTTPRTAAAQRDWLAAGNGFRVDPVHARPGDLVFYDSYLGPNVIGHVAIVLDAAAQRTLEAMDTRHGVTHGSYAGKAATKTIFEIWRVGNVADDATRPAA
jgi:hypothetical protein